MHVHPNLIYGFKDNVAAPFVGLFGILFSPSLNVKSCLLMNLLYKLCFLFAILTCSDIGKGDESKGVNGLKPYAISKGENLVAECII